VAGKSLLGKDRPQGGYSELRQIECFMVQEWGLHALDDGSVPVDVSAIWKVVTSPRD
jgi:hypothetical protein